MYPHFCFTREISAVFSIYPIHRFLSLLKTSYAAWNRCRRIPSQFFLYSIYPIHRFLSPLKTSYAAWNRCRRIPSQFFLYSIYPINFYPPRRISGAAKAAEGLCPERKFFLSAERRYGGLRTLYHMCRFYKTILLNKRGEEPADEKESPTL